MNIQKAWRDNSGNCIIHSSRGNIGPTYGPINVTVIVSETIELMDRRL